MTTEKAENPKSEGEWPIVDEETTLTAEEAGAAAYIIDKLADTKDYRREPHLQGALEKLLRIAGEDISLSRASSVPWE